MTCESGGIDQPFLTSALDGSKWTASRPCSFTPEKIATGAHWIRGWVGPRAGLDAVEKSLVPVRNRALTVQCSARRYTDWVITTPPKHLYKICIKCSWFSSPCGGGIEYLHRDPASRRRRRKGKSQMWDSKIRSRVPKDSDQRKIALARASSIYKRQNRPLVREGASQEQDRNCHTSNKDLVVSPRWVLYSKTDWLRHKAQTQIQLIFKISSIFEFRYLGIFHWYL
jgi:hypothetical protein